MIQPIDDSVKVRAASGALVYAVPAVALAAVVLPSAVRHLRRWAGGAIEGKTYTG